MPRPPLRLACCLLAVAAALGGAGPGPTAVAVPGCRNVFRLSERVYCGNCPAGDDGFRALAALGVRTIISVDGARPDVEAARRHGLRYVHVPVGYDGIPRAQALRIAKAVRDLPGSVYVHCHHGKHRGPTAAAIAERFLDPSCSAEAALAVMTRAGTDRHYPGLYASVRTLAPPAPGELERLPADFPEVAPVPPLARLMTAADAYRERLEAAQAAGWRAPPAQPDVDPAHEALQLAELFQEAWRRPDLKRRPEPFGRCLEAQRAAAWQLEAALRDPAHTAANEAFRRLGAACTSCHTAVRDNPIERAGPATAPGPR